MLTVYEPGAERTAVEDVVTVQQMADRVNISVDTFTSYLQRGRYDIPEPALRLGRTALWTRSQADAWQEHYLTNIRNRRTLRA